MKVVHAISDLGLKSGGPSLSTYLLVKGLRAAGVDAHIVTCAVTDPSDAAIASDAFVHAVPAPRYRRWGYSAAFGAALEGLADAEVFHGHGLWQYATFAAARCARRHGRPYVVSTRGMLYPEALRISGGVKRVALSLYQRRDLCGAACIHATCEQEHDVVRACGISAPIAVIPNPVEVRLLPPAQAPATGKHRVGFIGRVDPIKNIESLIEAWARVRVSEAEWELVIVGGGDEGYVRSLGALAGRLKLGNVSFTGFLHGREKDEMLASFRYLVLPSKSENFGMVVPEALMCGIPVIASTGTPWSDLDSASGRCGWWVSRSADGLAGALREAVALDDAARQAMGMNGRKLVETRYNLGAVASQMSLVYRWVQSAGEVPACVRFA